ncbi:MAG: ATP-dependent DNA helicase, partial [Solimonas sp.]
MRPEETAELLGVSGPFADLPGFAPREPQQRMAEAVASAFEGSESLIVEAGTGTGKTYAYLVPALLSGKRTLVSTGTRTLQDQLFHRDLPRVRDALRVPSRVALLKGRANYLCLYRMKRARGLPALRWAWDRLRTIEDWSRRTLSGELAEMGEFREDDGLTRQITSTADNCLGSRCDDFEQCFVAKARRAAQAADLVVVNHHLLLADFVLKDQGFGQILSGSDAIIIDEAHQLPELAAEFFGRRVSTRQLQELARDVQAEAQLQPDLSALAEAAQVFSGDVARFEQLFAGLPQRQPLAAFLADGERRRSAEQVGESLASLRGLLSPLEERNAEFAAALERAVGLLERWTHVLREQPPEHEMSEDEA